MLVKIFCLCGDDNEACDFVIDTMTNMGYIIQRNSYGNGYYDFAGVKEFNSLLDAHLEETQIRKVCDWKLLETKIRLIRDDRACMN